MFALRAAYAVAVTAVAVWLLLEGLPLGAIVVVMLGIWSRRTVESGRVERFDSRFARPSQ